jgi:hypothetical protein
MRLKEFLSELHAKKIRVFVEDGKIKCSAPKGAIDIRVKQLLSEFKSEIIKYDGRGQLHIPRVAPQEYYQTTYHQNIEWVHRQIADVHNWGPIYVQRIMPFDLNALVEMERAIDWVFHRHEIFRTTLHTIDGCLQQKIHEKCLSDVFIKTIDLTFYENPQMEIENLMVSELKVNTDFVHDCPFRGILIKTKQSYFALFTVVHSSVDEVSVRMIMQEIEATYQKLINGEKLLPLEEALEYKDYAAWESEQIKGEQGKKHHQYWKSMLVENIPALNSLKYICDRDSEKSLSYREAFDEGYNAIGHNFHPMFRDIAFNNLIHLWVGDQPVDRVQFCLDQSIHQALLNLIREKRIKLNVFLISSVSVLLRKLSGLEKSFMFVLDDTRIHNDLYQVAGCFIRGMLFLSEVRDDMTIVDVCKLVDEQLDRSYSHKIYPFVKVTSELDLSLAAIQNFQLNIVNLPSQEIVPFDLRHMKEGIAEKGIQFDVRVFKNTMVFDCQYICELFNSPTIENIMNYYRNLLSDIVLNPENKISQFLELANYPKIQK